MIALFYNNMLLQVYIFLNLVPKTSLARSIASQDPRWAHSIIHICVKKREKVIQQVEEINSDPHSC